MKTLFKSIIYSIVIMLTFGLSISHAFNAGAHLYIAERVFPNNTQKIDLYYGSIAPDLALYVNNPSKWPTAFTDTHYDFIDLRSYAMGGTQKAFAMGWLTHNEKWGADHYAHINYRNGEGYVITKAKYLSSQTGLNPDFAHFAIEAAIDLLLRHSDDSKLGEKLLEADLLRSWKDRNLLVNVLVLKERRTDWLTLAAAELNFRNLVSRYALALALPTPQNKNALAKLGSQLAHELYNIEATPEEVKGILDIAIGLCETDYKEFVDFTIEQIRNNIS